MLFLPCLIFILSYFLKIKKKKVILSQIWRIAKEGKLATFKLHLLFWGGTFDIRKWLAQQ